MTSQAWIAAAIFVASYIAIATDKIDRTIVALVGAALMLVLGLIDQSKAFRGIDLNVIFLLAGMMITVNIVKRSGLFEWLALSTAKLTGRRPVLMLVTLSLVTAVISAFLDNVTTMILIAPITLLIADAMRVDPVPLLLSETMASNIGGTATLIGDPPNILVGSAASLSFLDFIKHLTPLVIIVLIVFTFMAMGLFGKPLKKSTPNLAALSALQPSRAIKDRFLLWKSLIVLALIFAAFSLHGLLGFAPATVAVAGGAILFLLSQLPPRERKIDPAATILAEIDWHTLFFFIGMFIMIAGLENTGVLTKVLELVVMLTQKNLLLTCMVILWGAAFLTMVTSAVPFVIAMIPVIDNLIIALNGGPLAVPVVQTQYQALWWSLALGACLGANGTMIGSAANMVVTSISNRSGYKITFGTFTKRGLPISLASLVLASLYILIRYFLLYD